MNKFLLLAGLSLPLPALAAVAPPTAFAPAALGRDYETVAVGSLADIRPLGRLSLILFAEGRPAREYDYVAEGFLGNYRAHPYADVLVKLVGNQVRSPEGINTPLDPLEPLSPNHQFTRLQGGFRFKLPRHLNLDLMGGKDVTGGPANTMEAGLTWWPIIYSHQPLGISVAASQDDLTHIQVYTYSLTLGVGRALGMKWYLTGLGQHYDGGLARKAHGRISGGISAGSPRGFGFKLGGGGGAHGTYADIAIFQLFRL